MTTATYYTRDNAYAPDVIAVATDHRTRRQLQRSGWRYRPVSSLPALVYRAVKGQPEGTYDMRYGILAEAPRRGLVAEAHRRSA